MSHPAFDLIADIGRDLTRAGDALFEARVKFGELRKLWMAAQALQQHQPQTAPSAAPAPAPPAAAPQAPAPAPVAPAPVAIEAPPPQTQRSPVRLPRYRLNGEPMSIPQLAARAGCSRGAMEQRLYKGMAPEDAVAAGARQARSDRKTAPSAAPPQPAPPPRPRSSLPGSALVVPPRPTTVASTNDVRLNPAQEAVELPDCKRTVAPAPPGRFEVKPEEVSPTFSSMRPGQYEPTGSAISRAYGGKS